MHSQSNSLCKHCQCSCICPWPKHRLPNENLLVLSLIQILCGMASVILSGVSISKKTHGNEVASGIWTGVGMMTTGFHGVLTCRRKRPCLMISLLVLAVVVSICSMVMTGFAASGVFQDSITYKNIGSRSQKILIHSLLMIVGLLESSVGLTTTLIVAREICIRSTIKYNGRTYLVAPAARVTNQDLNSYLLRSDISHLYLSRERDSEQVSALTEPVNSTNSDNPNPPRLSSQSWSCRSHVTGGGHSSTSARPSSLLLFMPYASPGDWPSLPPPPYTQRNYSSVIDQHFQTIDMGSSAHPPRSPTIYEPSPNESPVMSRVAATSQPSTSTDNRSTYPDSYCTIPRHPEIFRQSQLADPHIPTDLPPSYESLGYGS